jgi:hypothetical protein
LKSVIYSIGLHSFTNSTTSFRPRASLRLVDEGNNSLEWICSEGNNIVDGNLLEFESREVTGELEGKVVDSFRPFLSRGLEAVV